MADATFYGKFLCVQVFLQSDIEAVVVRMKEEFVRYSKGKLAVEHGEWLEENPFVVRSDWERHVLDRSGQMYRLMLCKSNCWHSAGVADI